MEVSHLYADDTILLEADCVGIWKTKKVINPFERAEPKVNLSKSTLMGINVSEEVSSSLASIMG